MHFHDSQYIFAFMCWVGMLAIAFGAALEIKERMAGNSLSDAHFWVRMTSAVCWLLSLGLMSFAVTAAWPQSGHAAEKHLFARILVIGMSFFLLALVISLVDFILFWRIRVTRRKQLAREMDQWIQETLEQASSPDELSSNE